MGPFIIPIGLPPVETHVHADRRLAFEHESGAFELEALSHLDSVYRVARWRCGDPAEAQDLVQDTYELAFKARATFTRTNMRAWLLTILKHRFLNLRRRRRIVEEVPLSAAEAVQSEPVPDVPAGVIRRDVEMALAKLAPELRLPLLLADVEELSMTEIAEVLEWPIGTVKSRLWRARREIGSLLQEYRREPS